MTRPENIRLGDLLIQQELLTHEQLKFALDEQKRSGRKLGRIVVESAFVTEEAISQALARQLQIPYVKLKHFNPKQELINLLLEAQARRFRAVVFEENNGHLRVGFVDPTDLQAYDEIIRLLRREADAKIASALALRLKLMSGLDISEKRLPQDGRFGIKVRNNPIDLRISTMPT